MHQSKRNQITRISSHGFLQENDKENEEKVNKLITEKFELKKSKVSRWVFILIVFSVNLLVVPKKHLLVHSQRQNHEKKV